MNGILYLWDGRAILTTDQMLTTFHQHYAASLAIALEGKLTVETEGGQGKYEAVLVGPYTRIRTNSPGVKMIALLMDPESYEFESLAGIISPGQLKSLAQSTFTSFKDSLWQIYGGAANEKQAWELHDNLLRAVHYFPPIQRGVDHRIRAMVKKLRVELPDLIRMKDLAQDFSVSEDRLIRLFKQNLGIPLRRYLLWLRILEAIRQLEQGANLTEAAHKAGFADSAHFSRTFKENFGFTPSTFFGSGSSIEVRFGDSSNFFF